MRGVVMHSPGDVRVEDRDDPRIIEPTDAVPLEKAAEGYQAMDERRATKVMLTL